MAKAAISIRGLVKGFPKFHLGPLDLTVPTGAIYGLIGPNGAGKTTTLDLLMGMGENDAGRIEVFGLDHERNGVKIKQQIGYVGPDLNFTAWGRVNRLLGFVRTFYKDWDHAYCTDLLARLNIGLNDRIATLSFGARTKLALVVALAHRPALLLLDEPLAGLDVISKQEVFSELLRVVQDENRTVVISSHDLHDLERVTDHMGIIHEGKLLLEGPTAELVEAFRTVECTVPDLPTPEGIPGVRLLQRKGDRYQFLADLRLDAPRLLESLGAGDIVTAPLTLEELFLALIRSSGNAAYHS